MNQFTATVTRNYKNGTEKETTHELRNGLAFITLCGKLILERNANEIISFVIVVA